MCAPSRLRPRPHRRDPGPRRTPRKGAAATGAGRRGGRAGPHLLQPPALLFLLLDALLALRQQLPLVLLVLPLLLLQLLPPQGLRPLLVGQLEPQKVPPQRRLAGQVQNGAARQERQIRLPLRAGPSLPGVPAEASQAGTSPTCGERGYMLKHGLSDPPLIPLLTPQKKQSPRNRRASSLPFSVTTACLCGSIAAEMSHA